MGLPRESDININIARPSHFSKAFDSIDQNITGAAIDSYGVDKKLTRLLREINGNATAAVRIAK